MQGKPFDAQVRANAGGREDAWAEIMLDRRLSEIMRIVLIMGTT